MKLCQKCRGAKSYMGMGTMTEKCNACKGSGIEKEAVVITTKRKAKKEKPSAEKERQDEEC